MLSPILNARPGRLREVTARERTAHKLLTCRRRNRVARLLRALRHLTARRLSSRA